MSSLSEIQKTENRREKKNKCRIEEKEIDEHPAILAQGYYIRALEWVLQEIDEIEAKSQ